MFRRATQEQTTRPARPLQSNSARGNGIAQSKPPSPSKGVKRKIEMADSGASSLELIHGAVEFDADDFSDDNELDLNKPDTFALPTKPPSQTPPVEYPNTDDALSRASMPKLEQSSPGENNSADIKYPDLPPIPDGGAPSSSIQLPWSSSPPSHFQPPPKRRTLPWKKKEEMEAEERRRKLTTPARPKQTLPWNKTASAIKEEQKELRRQYKNQKSNAEPKDHQPRTKIASIFLSEEQRGVLEAVSNQGKSMFFTGSAGTGKSVLMREIISTLRRKYEREKDRVAVTASTGLAACNIEGVTLHSFAGIGLGKDPVPELVKKIKRNQKARNRWLRTKILIIDEVSMVDGDLFDKLEEIARRIRNNGRPFGGIQLVITGDFFQLPPVPDGGKQAKFAFSAATWNTCVQHTILLTHVFRQKDPQFAGMLNEMRLGKISPPTIEAFKRLSRPLDFHDSIEATELFPTRSEVESANGARMGRLSGESMTFNALDSGTIQDIQMREKLLANCMAPPTIHLKKGAQVMLIKNMEDTLVNGSIGRVVAFMDEATYGFYTENEYDFAVDEGNLSDEERASRARKKLKSMYNKDGGIVTSKKWPLVCFVLPDGTERHLLCHPETWKIELPNGEVQAQRQQIPLILAWALSIHKAQGQTLQRVKVDLGKVFEKGQAYVALSRATSQTGLQITRFDARKVMVHPKVADFYSNLSNITQVLKTKNTKTAHQLEDEFDDFDDEYLEHICG